MTDVIRIGLPLWQLPVLVLIPLAVLELSIAVALLVSSRCFWRRQEG